MVRSNVKVLLRTRPTENFAKDAVQIDAAAKALTIKSGVRTALGDKESATQLHQFKFDGVLHNATQEAVFEASASEVVAGALRGFNGTIMCYGQTGAGKTYTMTGGRDSYPRRGLIPRTVAALLAALRSAPGLSSWSLGVSYLEIYNETLYDLLDISTQPQELALYEDGRGALQVSGLRKVPISSEQDALALFFEGETNRVIGEHQLNRASSRSHCIFILELQLVPEGGTGQALASKVTLVDLAGSERVSKTRSDGQVLREAGYINRSLHMLEQVVLAASEKGRDHIPYRSCKLTHVLKDSLGGNCNTVLVANIWGEAAQLEETLSTCRFAARMARMTAEVISNVMAEGGVRVRQLEREVQELQEELAMMALFYGHHAAPPPGDGLGADADADAGAGAATTAAADGAEGAAGAGAGAVPRRAAVPAAYKAYSEQQRQELRRLVMQWLAGTEPPSSPSPVPITSMRQLWEVLAACRHLYHQAHRAAAAEQQVAHRGAGPLPYSSSSSSGRLRAAAGASDSAAAATAAADPRWRELYNGVGEVDAADQSSGAGVAPEHARPSDAGDGEGWGAAAAPLPARGWQHGVGSTSGSGAGGSPGHGRAAADAALAEEYRSGAGAAKAQVLNDNHAKMQAAKRRQKELAVALNATKARIDALRQQQEALKAQRLAEGGEAAQVLSDEELQVLEDLSSAKARYKEDWGELAAVRSEVQYTAGLVEACSQELAQDFKAWQQQQQQQQQQRGVSHSTPPEPGQQATPAARGSADAAAAAAAAAAGRRGSRTTTPPLASLVTGLSTGDDAADVGAQFHYAAQRSALAAQLAVGAAKQHRGEKGTFTHAARTNIQQQVLRTRALET